MASDARTKRFSLDSMILRNKLERILSTNSKYKTIPAFV